MSGTAPQPLPPSRALTAWWPDLARRAPTAVWLANLRIWSVEATVLVREACQPDPLERLVLETVAQAPTNPLDTLADEHAMGRVLAGRALARLAQRDLIQRGSDAAWHLSECGEKVRQGADVPMQRAERRSFAFVQHESDTHFLPLNPSAPFRPASSEPRFDLDTLRSCANRSDEWKLHYRFPREVVGVIEPQSAGDSWYFGTSSALPRELREWERVAVGSPGQLQSVMLRCPGADGERMLGYAVVSVAEPLFPAFELGAEWSEIFPALVEAPSLSRWSEAWRAWAHEARLTRAEVDACQLERAGSLIRALLPSTLFRRLKRSRPDAIAQGVWLFADAGDYRAATQLELLER